MAIASFTATRTDADGLTWAKDKLDAFVTGLTSYLNTEVAGKAPDRTSTATISGVWTFTNANTFSGNNTFSGQNTFSQSNTFTGDNTFTGQNTSSGRFTFNGANGLLLPTDTSSITRAVNYDTTYGTPTVFNGVLSAPLSPFSCRGYIYLMDDFGYSAVAALAEVGPFGLTESTAGAGSTVAANPNAADGRWGVLGLNTGTTNVGTVYLESTNGFQHTGAGTFIAEFAIRVITALSDATDRFTVRCGLATSVSAGDTSNGIYIRYTDNVNSGKWQLVHRRSSVETAVDTTVTTDTNWHTFKFICDPSAGTTTLYVDDVLKVTNSSNLPLTTATLAPFISIIKSAGTNSRDVNIDYFTFFMKLPALR